MASDDQAGDFVEWCALTDQTLYPPRHGRPRRLTASTSNGFQKFWEPFYFGVPAVFQVKMG
jgi:hypothetical protein